MSALTPHVDLEKVRLSSSIVDEFVHKDFADCNTVRIAFRTLGSRKNEHYLNKYAGRLDGDVLVPVVEERGVLGEGW